jgi:hypothetical protein
MEEFDQEIEEGREKHAALMVLITSKYKGFPPFLSSCNSPNCAREYNLM